MFRKPSFLNLFPPGNHPTPTSSAVTAADPPNPPAIQQERMLHRPGGGRGRGRCDLLGPMGETFSTKLMGKLRCPDGNQGWDVYQTHPKDDGYRKKMRFTCMKFCLIQIRYLEMQILFKKNPLQFLVWIKKTHCLFQTLSAIWPIWLTHKIHGSSHLNQHSVRATSTEDAPTSPHSSLMAILSSC